MGYSIPLIFCLEITRRCYNLEKIGQQFQESLSMSWLTITNLGRDKSDALYRLASTLYWTIAHTITFTVILAICNIDRGIVDIIPLINWSELPLAQDLFTLNILLISTISLGVLSLLLDVSTAAIKNCCRSRDSNTRL